MKIIFLGGPGAGKGTQAQMLKDKLNIPHISTGELFRQNIANNTTLGQAAKKYIDQAILVPDDVTLGMLFDRIKKEDCKNGFILDGVPRTIPQAIEIDNRIQDYKVIYIKMSDGEMLKRVTGRWTCKKCGKVYHELFNPEKIKGVCDKDKELLYQRDSDKPETQKKRIEEFHQMTEPLIEFYKQKQLILEVNGEATIQEIHQNILNLLKTR